MRLFLATLGAEAFKLRRTPVLLVLIVAPYVVTLFFFLFAFFDGERFLSGGNAWVWLGNNSFTFWSLVVLPMWAAIITTQIASIEHRAGGFKHLFTLPVGRLTLYMAKQTLCWLLAGAAFFGLALAIAIAGLGLRMLRPGLGFEAALPVGRLLAFAGGGFLASFFLVALHTWLAHQLTDVATPIATGFLATASMLALSGLDASLVSYHPWAYPSRLVGSWVSGDVELVWMAVGVAGGGLFAWVAGRSFVGRDVL